jgi:hypothetical protein
MTQYSALDIHTALHSIFEEDYAFYQSIFSSQVAQIGVQTSVQTTQPAPQPEPAPQPQPASQPQQPPLTQTPELPKITPSTKIRIVKKPAPEPEAAQEQAQPPVQDDTKVAERERKATIKKEQAEKEAEKHAELVSKGVDPETLLTKDNLKKWVDTDGLTYTQIARDHVGLSSNQIAAVAKGFGIQSPIVKKRAMIVARRK